LTIFAPDILLAKAEFIAFFAAWRRLRPHTRLGRSFLQSLFKGRSFDHAPDLGLEPKERQSQILLRLARRSLTVQLTFD
jgi:hypothetical protein